MPISGHGTITYSSTATATPEAGGAAICVRHHDRHGLDRDGQVPASAEPEASTAAATRWTLPAISMARRRRKSAASSESQRFNNGGRHRRNRRQLSFHGRRGGSVLLPSFHSLGRTMLILLAAIALSQVATPARPPIADDCDEKQGCVRAMPAQMFALADKLYERWERGRREPEFSKRSPRTFTPNFAPKLGSGWLRCGRKRAIWQARRRPCATLLAEQPTANPARLELARILGRHREKEEARKRDCERRSPGLPAEVQQNVRRFASASRPRSAAASRSR